MHRQDVPSSNEDSFWKIALEDHGGGTLSVKENDSSEQTSIFTLTLPPPFGTVQWHLTPLPESEGAAEGSVRPLGAQAWYGSALLSALLLDLPSPHDNPIQRHIRAIRARASSTFHLLELGSGAVGLAGLVAGFSTLGYLHTIPSPMEEKELTSCCVILTDHDPAVVRQLERNVRDNEIQWKQQFSLYPEFVMQTLDWKDGWKGTKAKESPIHLVMGSELIYNTETAKACLHIVLQLLQDHPDVLVVLVQGTHREGWKDLFLPTLQSTPGIRIEESTPALDLHNVAARWVAPGGTLQPLADFTVCYIDRSHPLATDNGTPSSFV